MAHFSLGANRLSATVPMKEAQLIKLSMEHAILNLRIAKRLPPAVAASKPLPVGGRHDIHKVLLT